MNDLIELWALLGALRAIGLESSREYGGQERERVGPFAGIMSQCNADKGIEAMVNIRGATWRKLPALSSETIRRQST
jgi:hypothetical protein